MSSFFDLARYIDSSFGHFLRLHSVVLRFRVPDSDFVERKILSERDGEVNFVGRIKMPAGSPGCSGTLLFAILSTVIVIRSSYLHRESQVEGSEFSEKNLARGEDVYQYDSSRTGLGVFRVYSACFGWRHFVPPSAKSNWEKKVIIRRLSCASMTKRFPC